MSKRLLLFLVPLCVAAFSPLQTTRSQKPALTDSERRGKEFYLRGTTPSGREIMARLNDLDVPASAFPCSGCHGIRGEGKSEGGVTAGDITWSNLIKPYGHTHPTGRKHGPFTESSVIRAVVNGVDPAGNDLLVAMPRYKVSPEEMADLLAYLKRIDTDLDPGVTETNITVGVVLPSSGALAEVGAAMKDVVAAYFDSVNNRGGIFNRKIELKVADAGAGGANTSTAAQNFAHKEQVFAFVSGLSAGNDPQLAALARTEEIPIIGPSTLLPYLENPANKYLFYLLPGVAEQAMSLVNYAAAQPELKRASAALVYSDAMLSSAAGAAAAEQAKKAGLTITKKSVFKSDAFDARAIVNDLKSSNVESLFFFGDAKEQSLLLNEAAAASWSPNLFLLGTLSGRDVPVPPDSKNKVFLAFPTVPSDVSSDGRIEFHALTEKYKIATRHAAAQLSAFAAAKVFVEGLTRAGRDLNREKFINALDTLYDYETGVTPRVTFGPNRRVGAAGAHIVTFDPAKKEYTPLGWTNAY
ncbi:MAG TPA: ABC transporter substrate-binding protein [Pyrinomonadaceae bacterium]|nr:ABC transporter substrate-binding protein [Pyrinomonadaceae bacterium]